MARESVTDEWKVIITDKYWINKSGDVWNGSYFMKTWIHKGYKELTLQIDKKKRHFMIHTLLARVFIPNPLNKPFVDHINGDKLDNRLENLRYATHSENTANRKKCNSETGYKGVSMTHNGKYKSSICHQGKSYYLGVFDTPKEAHDAYCKKGKELHKEFHNPGIISVL